MEVFYALAIEQMFSYTTLPVEMNKFETLEEAREERDLLDCPEGITILKCEVIE
jgi:hypothetical protein